ncbi:MAG: hypothetical protein RMJ83_10025 [Armatimonadota bacterium]|nr:hypothetical protein [Armatimonadota bacterium]
MPLTQTDLNELVSLLEAHPESQLPLLRLLMSKQNVRELLLQDQELLLILRGLIIGEELARLPAQVEEVKQTTLQAVGQLTQEVAKTKQIALHTAERVDRIEREVSNLSATTARIEAWQRGEEGRRRKEELEKRVQRQAVRLFNGGTGGTPEDAHGHTRLREWLTGRQALDQRKPSSSFARWQSSRHSAPIPGRLHGKTMLRYPHTPTTTGKCVNKLS